MSVCFWEWKNLNTIPLGFTVHVRSDLIVADLRRIVWVYFGLGLYILLSYLDSVTMFAYSSMCDMVCRVHYLHTLPLFYAFLL